MNTPDYSKQLAKLLFHTLPIDASKIKRYTIFTEGDEENFSVTDNWWAMNWIEFVKQLKAFHAFTTKRTKTINPTWVISLSKNYKQEIADYNKDIDNA